MNRDFSRYPSTNGDWRIFHKWARGVAIFYGLIGLLVVGFVAFRNYQTGMSHNTAAAAPAATMIAIKNNRAH
jgi:prolipoprotein diacylglyceryltransferase